MHRSRLGALVIDCQADELDAAIRFWSGALGCAFAPDPADPRYAKASVPAGMPRLLLQRVEHPSRVHLDIETDDKDAERARLERLGAVLVERHAKGWIVMEAPTGQRFCLIDAESEGFAEAAREHP